MSTKKFAFFFFLIIISFNWWFEAEAYFLRWRALLNYLLRIYQFEEK